MGLEFVRATAGRDVDVDEGLQTSLFVLDSLGIPTANVTNQQQHVQHGHADTGWKPDIDTYMISETIYGSLKPLDAAGKPTGGMAIDKGERRKLTYDKTATPQYKYYINDVLQAYVPAPLDPAVTILLGSHPVIGFKDTIDDRALFEVRNIIK